MILAARLFYFHPYSWKSLLICFAVTIKSAYFEKASIVHPGKARIINCLLIQDLYKTINFF